MATESTEDTESFFIVLFSMAFRGFRGYLSDRIGELHVVEHDIRDDIRPARELRHAEYLLADCAVHV